MNARILGWLPFLFLVAGVANATTYPVRNLQPSDALMALRVKVPGVNQDCKVTVQEARDTKSAGIKGVLDIVCGDESNQSKIQPALDVIDAAPPTQQFHIAVLSASRKDGPMPELSPSEMKALNDFKKVMTYRSFTVEAETILASDRTATTQLNGSYEVEMGIGPRSGDVIQVEAFQLRAASPEPLPGGKATYYRTYVQTSFAVKKGETVVLGASVSDQQARVVLVTALP